MEQDFIEIMMASVWGSHWENNTKYTESLNVSLLTRILENDSWKDAWLILVQEDNAMLNLRPSLHYTTHTVCNAQILKCQKLQDKFWGLFPWRYLPLKLGQDISYNYTTLNGLIHVLVAFKEGKHVPTVFHGQPSNQLLYHLQGEERPQSSTTVQNGLSCTESSLRLILDCWT